MHTIYILCIVTAQTITMQVHSSIARIQNIRVHEIREPYTPEDHPIYSFLAASEQMYSEQSLYKNANHQIPPPYYHGDKNSDDKGINYSSLYNKVNISWLKENNYIFDIKNKKIK